MSKRAYILSLTLLLLLLGTATTLLARAGGNVAVTANGNNTFTPDEVTILVGQSVDWSNVAGFHNVVADDNSFTSGDPSDSAWMFTQQFPAAGRFAYYCAVHGNVGGVGMSGVVNVVDAAAYLPVVSRP